MEIEILEKKNRSLFVYDNDEIIFYSTIKFNWTQRNLIKIFNKNDEQILELKSYTPFFTRKYKILSQNQNLTKSISKITENEISFEKNETLRKESVNTFSFNQNMTYYSKGIKIGEIKQKIWNDPQKIKLIVNEEYLKFLDQIVIHLLAIKTGDTSSA